MKIGNTENAEKAQRNAEDKPLFFSEILCEALCHSTDTVFDIILIFKGAFKMEVIKKFLAETTV
jgi:hypothetical protein